MGGRGGGGEVGVGAAGGSEASSRPSALLPGGPSHKSVLLVSLIKILHRLPTAYSSVWRWGFGGLFAGLFSPKEVCREHSPTTQTTEDLTRCVRGGAAWHPACFPRRYPST